MLEQQEMAMTEPERGMIPQAGVILGSILGGLFLIAAAVVGFTDRGSAGICGSVLGGGSTQLTLSGEIVCDRALSSPTTWTVILFVLAVVSFVVGLAITLVKKSQERASTGS